jgi:hypothetical protein
VSTLFLKSTHQITRQEYDKLRTYSKAEVRDYIENIANKSPFPAMGYGCYNTYFYEEDGECFVSWQHMSSCD